MSGNEKLPKNRISELRKEKKLSQSQLARDTGLTRQAISLYEIGKREPKLETWVKLADYFHVSTSYLQGLTDIRDVNAIVHYANNRPVLTNSEYDALIHRYTDEQTANYFMISDDIFNVLYGTNKGIYLKKLESNIQDGKLLHQFVDNVVVVWDMFLHAANNTDKQSSKFYGQLNSLINEYRKKDNKQQNG